MLLAKYKIGVHNCVRFTETKSMPGDYYIAGEEAKKHPINTNGKLDFYAVPLNKLEKLERE